MKRTIIVLAVLIFATLGCQPTKITRVEEDKEVDLSGRWNDPNQH